MDGQDDVGTRAEFEALLACYSADSQRLVELTERVALAEVRAILPDAAVVEVRGWMNEDWLKVLRIGSVRSSTGELLFDVEVGADPEIEDAIHEIGAELLDLLVDLTGDTYMGNHILRYG